MASSDPSRSGPPGPFRDPVCCDRTARRYINCSRRVNLVESRSGSARRNFGRPGGRAGRPGGPGPQSV
eukprot:765824-Hanusia_phi.AAC.1